METVNVQDTQQLAETLGDHIAERLEQAINARGFAILVVSGGSTPKPLFQYLSRKPLDWSKVTVTLADERCVPPDSELSNARQVHENLLQNLAASASFIQLHTDGIELEASVKQADKRLSELPTYDCVVLGMGGDGHTASIFPRASNRDQALALDNPASAMLIDPVTVEPLRITQTARRLLDTDWMILHITGEEKVQLLGQILKSPNPQKWPISYFLSQTGTPFSVYQNSSYEQESRP